MRIKFENRLAAINWIANNVTDEGQFEILREQLTYNEIYTGLYYLVFDKKELESEVIMLKSG